MWAMAQLDAGAKPDKVKPSCLRSAIPSMRRYGKGGVRELRKGICIMNAENMTREMVVWRSAGAHYTSYTSGKSVMGERTRGGQPEEEANEGWRGGEGISPPSRGGITSKGTDYCRASPRTGYLRATHELLLYFTPRTCKV